MKAELESLETVIENQKKEAVEMKSKISTLENALVNKIHKFGPP